MTQISKHEYYWVDLSGQFGYSPLFSLTHSKSSNAELLTWEVSDDSLLDMSTPTIRHSNWVASGEPFCIWHLLSRWLRPVPPARMVAWSPHEIRIGITLVFFLLLHACYEGFPL